MLRFSGGRRHTITWQEKDENGSNFLSHSGAAVWFELQMCSTRTALKAAGAFFKRQHIKKPRASSDAGDTRKHCRHISGTIKGDPELKWTYPASAHFLSCISCSCVVSLMLKLSCSKHSSSVFSTLESGWCHREVVPCFSRSSQSECCLKVWGAKPACFSSSEARYDIQKEYFESCKAGLVESKNRNRIDPL